MEAFLLIVQMTHGLIEISGEYVHPPNFESVPTSLALTYISDNSLSAIDYMTIHTSFTPDLTGHEDVVQSSSSFLDQ